MKWIGACRSMVYRYSTAMSDLEAIVHPAVRRAVHEQQAEATRERAPSVAIEAIKLVEGGLGERCNEGLG